MKQSKIKNLTQRNWKNTLSKMDEYKLPNLFKAIKEVTETKS